MKLHSVHAVIAHHTGPCEIAVLLPLLLGIRTSCLVFSGMRSGPLSRTFHTFSAGLLLIAVAPATMPGMAEEKGSAQAGSVTSFVRTQPLPGSIITVRAFLNFGAVLGEELERLRQESPPQAETVRRTMVSQFGLSDAEFDDLINTSSKAMRELARVRKAAQVRVSAAERANMQPERRVLEQYASQEEAIAQDAWRAFQQRLTEESRKSLGRYISEVYVKGITVWHAPEN